MIVNNQKFACNSCIRGHRVSNCNHADRDLFLIAPKGRPVKQCEHCRSARKDKSHHAKCDCGSKKHKDSTARGEPKNENVGCCCRNGTKCVCGVKSEAADLRLQTSLSRTIPAVQSKPALTSSSSDSRLTVFANGHHKPVHRNNNLGHTSGAPYKIPPRPHSLQGSSSYVQESADHDDTTPSEDDMQLLGNGDREFGNSVGAQLSPDTLLTSPFSTTFNSSELGWPLLGGSPESVEDDGLISRTASADTLSTSISWYDPILSTVAEAPGDFSTSPTGVFDFTDTDWSIPYATTDFFSPSDLPLVTSQPSDFSQPISHSGESSYQSAPALTAPSSGAQSEIGEPAYPIEGDASAQRSAPSYWSDTVQFRDANSLRAAPMLTGYTFPQSLPTFDGGLKRKPMQSRHRQTYSAGSNSSHHAYHLSDSTDSTTVADDHSVCSGVNIGHLQNLASLKMARDAAAASRLSSPSYTPVCESELRSITIPASLEDGPNNDDWYFPLADHPQSSAQSAEYAWLT